VELRRYVTEPDENGLSLHLDFGIVQEYPLVIWKAAITNQGNQPVAIDRLVVLDLEAGTGSIQFSQAEHPTDLGFFSNGWQSWSPAQWYPADGRMHTSRLGLLQLPMIKYAGTPYPHRRGEFSSDFFAVIGDRKARTGFLVGFLAQKEQFGSITCRFGSSPFLQMWANGDGARLDPQKEMETDWAVFNPLLLDHRDPLDKYTEAVARENGVSLPPETPLGWCSWYQYSDKVTPAEVRQNLNELVRSGDTLPVELVQIDDGFETQVGDWFSFKRTFNEGLKPLADEIRQEGLLPGLWLAPFAVHPRSKLFKDHPDWILRKKNGKPVNAGFGWGSLFTGLDLTVPSALDYAVSVVKTACTEWGFPYLKLDFLYTAALPGRYADGTRTRAQVMRMGMQAIREAVGPDVFILGCGVPLGSAVGLVDANRISADVRGTWTPEQMGVTRLFTREPAMPAARNAIHNMLTRANLHGHWWRNDPDCLLLSEDTHLTLEEVRSLASGIALTGGSLLISDDLSKVSPARMRIAESLIPVIGERARVVDWFDREMPEKLRLDLLNDTGEWHVLGAFNWEDRPRDITLVPADFGLAEGEYWLCEFWRGQLMPFNSRVPAVLKPVGAHGAVVCAVRRAAPGHALYLGSDLHISQGLEVSAWNEQTDRLEFKLRLPRTAKGKVVVSVPKPVEHITVNDQDVKAKTIEGGVLQISLTVEGFATIIVSYGLEK